jgi:hypothetical protein
MIAADVQDRHGCRLQSRQDGVGRENRIPGPVPEERRREVDRDRLAAVSHPLGNAVVRALCRFPTRPRSRLEEQNHLVLERVLRAARRVVEELLGGLHERTGRAGADKDAVADPLGEHRQAGLRRQPAERPAGEGHIVQIERFDEVPRVVRQ